MGENLHTRTSAAPKLIGELVGDSIAAISLVDGLVQDATRALFETYGVKLALDGIQISKLLKSIQLLSMIGFCSDRLSGSLLLALPQSVVQRTLPAPDASTADWSGELVNQLLGRLKNQLLKYETVITPSLPVVVTGEGMHLPASTRQVTRFLAFASEWGQMFVRLEMEIHPGLELERRQHDSHEANIDEGELLLF
jgi:hypothetical protein